MGVEAPSYKGFRFPVEIISHCVWLYLWVPNWSSMAVTCGVPRGDCRA